MPDPVEKVKELRARVGHQLNIQVDGGVSEGETVEAVAAAGANVIVSGSGVFGSKDPRAAVAAMRKVTNQHRKQQIESSS